MEENQGRDGTEDTEGVGDDVVGLADDRLYRCLVARPRRRLLYYLLDAEGTIVEEIAEVLTGWAGTEQGGMATVDEYEQVLLSLRHAHLPTLADAGLVTYDPDDGTVGFGEMTESARDLLRRSTATEKM